MRRTEPLQGLRSLKSEAVYGRTYRGESSQAEAAEVPGHCQSMRATRTRTPGSLREPSISGPDGMEGTGRKCYDFRGR